MLAEMAEGERFFHWWQPRMRALQKIPGSDGEAIRSWMDRQFSDIHDVFGLTSMISMPLNAARFHLRVDADPTPGARRIGEVAAAFDGIGTIDRRLARDEETFDFFFGDWLAVDPSATQNVAPVACSLWLDNDSQTPVDAYVAAFEGISRSLLGRASGIPGHRFDVL